ncbi:MAG: FAD-dependent oxidoreductase [Candidatus Lokiarchaeota archaeon]|nr:FAD-dependent oxidoreductase [Candidatus Lokiarchaeota archaeon]
MSFELLREEIVDAGLCQGCGLCAGSCKHVEMDVRRPTLKDYCILERDGQDCGKCYQNCPQVIQKKFKEKQPLAIYSLRSKDPEILDKASSGGFVTTFAKELLENKSLKEIVMVQEEDEKPTAEIVSDPNEVVQKAGVIYGRSGVLQRLVELTGETFDPIGIVGVPCEMRGAAELEEDMNREILKIGLFCSSQMRTEQTDKGLVCSPCCNGCPSGVNAQGYISLIRQGKYQDAVDLIRENNPLPSICGRICTNECEHGCTLIGDDHPVAIRELKKFVTEWEIERAKNASKTKTKSIKNAKKIAIIGSGPAGLTAAFFLRRMGYAPTIFEKTDQTGGMLRFGVPQFRLPNYVLDYDVGRIIDSGVKIILNKPLGPEMTIDNLKKDGFEAIFIATGQYKPRTLHLEGENLPNVHVAISFLMDRKYRYWENKEEFKGKTLGIIGGGAVAVDVAQTALRLGADKVHLVDIMSQEQLELVLRDIPENEMDFMEYHFKTSTSKITQNKEEKLILNCYNIEWGNPDENGRSPLNKIEGSDYEIPVDFIVIAVGQAVDFEQIDAATNNKLEKERNRIRVNEITFETNIPGVFAGGDIISNSKAVAIAAIAHGKETAFSIDRYLKGESLMEGRFKIENSFFTGPKKPPKDYSLKPETLDAATEEISWSFEEIDKMFNEDMALQEARRCLSCNHFCTHCQDFPAIYSDLTAGEVGSKNGYTTVVVWTERGKALVEEAIEKGLFEQGKVDEEELRNAINLKSKRELMNFEKTPRQQVLDYITLQGSSTISDISRSIGIEPKKARYEALRLVQLMELEMKAEPGMEEPIFSIICD